MNSTTPVIDPPRHRPLTVVFATDDARALVWRMAPLIEAIVAARHRVIGLVPTLAKADNLMLAGLGVELMAPEAPTGFFGRLSAGRIVEQHLSALQADVAVGHGSEFGLAALEIFQRDSKTHTVLAAAADDLIGLDAVARAAFASAELRENRWRPVVAKLDALIVPTAEDRRRVMGAKGWPQGLTVVAAALPGTDGLSADDLVLPPLDGVPRVLLVPDPDDERPLRLLLDAVRHALRARPKLQFGLVGTLAPDGMLDGVTPLLDARAIDAALNDALAVVVPMTRGRVPPLTYEALRRGRALIVPSTPLGRALVDEPMNGLVVTAAQRQEFVPAWAHAFVKAADFSNLAVAMARSSAQKADRAFDRRDILSDVARAFPAHVFKLPSAAMRAVA